MTEVATWWDIAQKIGSGAAFVLGVGCLFIWKAYQKELEYSKSRDLQTLTVLLNLTKMIEGQKDSSVRYESSMATLIETIRQLTELVKRHCNGK